MTATSVRSPVARNRPGALLRAVRPRQWVKNVLVLAAPLSAGALDQTEVLGRAVVAFVVFCLAAAGVYLVNDVLDVAADRAHPTKRLRPIASGEVSPRLAAGLGSVLLIVAPVAALLATRELAVTILTYEGIQLAYCLWLKHQPVVDLAVVSSGFLLRAIAGGTASGITLSQWFLLVAAFGSLFMVAGKRYSEKHNSSGLSVTRASLEEYSESYLRFVWGMAASVTTLAYALWAFELRAQGVSPLPAISIAPFVLCLLRYAVDIDRGAAGAPEDIVLGDKVLQVFGLLWLVLFAVGVAVR